MGSTEILAIVISCNSAHPRALESCVYKERDYSAIGESAVGLTVATLTPYLLPSPAYDSTGVK